MLLFLSSIVYLVLLDIWWVYLAFLAGGKFVLLLTGHISKLVAEKTNTSEIIKI